MKTVVHIVPGKAETVELGKEMITWQNIGKVLYKVS
jgi:hypothetical protein